MDLPLQEPSQQGGSLKVSGSFGGRIGSAFRRFFEGPAGTEEDPGSAHRARDVQASLRQGGGRTRDPHGTEVDSDPLGTSQWQDHTAHETTPAHSMIAM